MIYGGHGAIAVSEERIDDYGSLAEGVFRLQTRGTPRSLLPPPASEPTGKKFEMSQSEGDA